MHAWSRMALGGFAFAIMLVSMLVGTGCSDLGEYRGDYSGEVAGATACSEGAGPCSFIRRGFPGGTRLVLEGFDPSVEALDLAAGVAPGFLTTDDAHCGPGTETFDREPLRPVAALAHDALSELAIPGAGRIKTIIYTLEPTRGPLAGRDAMAFVTLLESETVEVRIIAGDGAGPDCASLTAGTPPADCGLRTVGDCDFFGVYKMAGGSS